MASTDDDNEVLCVLDETDCVSSRLETHFDVVRISGGDIFQLIGMSNPAAIVLAVTRDDDTSLELCARIKTQDDTGLIPLILMTPDSPGPIDLEGLKHGADAVIGGDLSDQLMTLKIHQILKVNSGVVRRSKSGFLEQVEQVIDEHLGDSEFDVESLADCLGIDRKTLYRRIKRDSNLTPQDYLRQHRLKHAATLLQKGDHRVSEVSSLVGFKHISYFTRCFKQLFGKCPSEF